MLVELTSYGDEKHKPEGRVKEIIGHINDPGTDILSVVYQYELPNEFPEKVMRQAEKTPQRFIRLTWKDGWIYGMYRW